MRLLAALALAGALAAGCASSPDPAEVDLLDREVQLLGAMAITSGPRSSAQVASVTACVTSARAHVRSIGRPR